MTEPIASLEELMRRMPGGVLMSEDEDRATAALEDASALIRSVGGMAWDPTDSGTSIPDIVVAICIAVAKRALIKPDTIASETIVTWTMTFRGDDSAIFLTKDERRQINAAAGRSALWTQATTRAEQDDQGVDIPDVPSVTEPPYGAPGGTSTSIEDLW